MNYDIEILFVAGCPRLQVAFDRAEQAVAALGLDSAVKIAVREVRSLEEAVDLGFFGSPSIHVNGRDVELNASDRTDVGLHCRLYRVDGRPDEAPPVEWIKAAIVRADR